jgi:hypothetical protein
MITTHVDMPHSPHVSFSSSPYLCSLYSMDLSEALQKDR